MADCQMYAIRTKLDNQLVNLSTGSGDSISIKAVFGSKQEANAVLEVIKQTNSNGDQLEVVLAQVWAEEDINILLEELRTLRSKCTIDNQY